MKKLDSTKLTFTDQTTPEDIDWSQIESLYASIGKKRPFHKTSRLKRSFSNSYSFCIVRKNNEIMGCGRTLSDGQVHGWIHDLAVSPKFQKQGIGTRILNKLVEQLKGVRYLGLLCSPDDIPFYERSGFQTGWTAMTMRQKTR